MTTFKQLLFISLLLLSSANGLFAQQLLDKTLVHDGATRSYTVYIPAAYQDNIQSPLLFNFHGGNGDIASQLFISDMRPIADTAGFIVVYPQALPDPNDGGSTNWTHKEPTTVDDIFFVAAMIDVLSDDYTIDPERVYACGYSNGGEFSFELACRLSSQIAAIGVVARSMYIDTFNECSPEHPTAIVTIHGTEDDYEGITFAGITYYVSLAEVNSYWSSYNNTSSTPSIVELPNLSSSDGSTVEHYSWENGDGCVSVDHYKVIGGGHDWPGSFGNMDIDANSVIWNFVSQYNRSGLIDCNLTAEEEVLADDLRFNIYPNPVTDLISIDLDITGQQKYRLFSSTGTLMKTGNIDVQNNTIDLVNIPPNLYLLQIGEHLQKFIKTE